MKMTPWLTKCGLAALVVLLFSSAAQSEQRLHIKCHLQTEDQSMLIRQFVISDGAKQQFINNLTEQTIFMADGLTKQQILAVYECVDLKGRFSHVEARELEKQTPR